MSNRKRPARRRAKSPSTDLDRVSLFDAMLPYFNPGTGPADESPRGQLARAIDQAIELLNAIDPDPDLEQDNSDLEEDDPKEHDDDDTDNAYEDIPTTKWFSTPSGTATVADFQKAIGDGRTGDDADAEPDFEGEAEQDGFGNPMLGWSMQGRVWPEQTKEYTPGDPAPRSPFGHEARNSEELPVKRVRR